MSLFQKSVLKKYLNELDIEKVHKAFTIFSNYFHNSEIQHNILDSKEEQFQEGFLRELFVKVFGYVLNPLPEFNLTTEFKNERGAKKADGAVLMDGKAIAVIELKSSKTKDLESIRQQAFDYKANHSDCVYVITSNFRRLRFYVNNAVEFEEFDLFTLNKDQFKLLYLCLNSQHILNGLPLKIKTASILEEENISKKFYADYSLFKQELFESIADKNIDIEGVSKLQLYKKTQKLLDRFLFIFFAEDRGLLPPNSISRMIQRWNVLNDEDAYKPLYEIYKQYFGYLNVGRKGKVPEDDIQAYNGGLFLPDEILDKIDVDDEVLLKHTSKLTNYDFESQVDVNILGHIFEHSLNEIENTTAELEGVVFDKQKSKRKKDGVFYTPKYITKYIVDNTVGKLCGEKKEELGIVDTEYIPNRQKETKKKLLANIEAYREWLLELTICDPACGSGAFLNQTLEFLINEHHYIDGLNAQLFGSAMVFQDVENQILEKNIYGVDINEESVDIARLSLWLRTAQRGRKLTSLSKNIKCGNSLIDDPEVAGEKAFNWEQEFPDVFDRGGFDVVIGNPPYVRAENLGEKNKNYFEKNYYSSFKQYDIYVLFYEKSISLLKECGVLGFITPNKFYLADYGKKIREYILSNTKILRIVDVSMMNIFPEASVYPTILVFSKTSDITGKIAIQPSVTEINQLEFEKDLLISQETFLVEEDFIINTNISNLQLLEKIDGKGILLGRLFKITRGFRPPKENLIGYKRIEGYYPYLIGEALSKAYNVKWNGKYVKYLPDEIPESKPVEILRQPKVMIRDIGLKFNAYMDSGKYFCLKTIYFIYGNNIEQLRYLTCILNSNLMNFYFKERFSSMHISGGYLRFRKQFIEKLPIVQVNDVSQLSNYCIEQQDKNKHNQNAIDTFLKFIQSQYAINKMQKKLQNWHELDYGEFISELNKAIKKAGGEKLSKMDEMEWMEVFETKKAEVQSIKAEIDKTDREIDGMVYKLYGLTEDEIRIVEESVK